MNSPNFRNFAIRLSTIALTVATALGAARGNAQGTIKVNVPFSFESGTSHLEAGPYLIHLNAVGPILRLEGTKSSIFQMTIPDSTTKPSEVSKVVFHRYGSRYILKEVWVAGSTSHVHTPTSKLEKELELAQRNADQRDTLALLAKSR